VPLEWRLLWKVDVSSAGVARRKWRGEQCRVFEVRPF
jgi:hypothetical protein